MFAESTVAYKPVPDIHHDTPIKHFNRCMHIQSSSAFFSLFHIPVPHRSSLSTALGLGAFDWPVS